MRCYGDRIGCESAALMELAGDALADLGDHVVGQPDQVPVVDRDPCRGRAARMPDAYGADGSMTTSSTPGAALRARTVLRVAMRR